MPEPQWIFININNSNSSTAPKDQRHVQVSLKDRNGKTVEEIIENALLSDRDFRDLSGLSIGLMAAKKLGIKRIMILTNNTFLETIIKNGQGKDNRNCFGFCPAIRGLIGSFEEVGVGGKNG